MMKPVIGIAVVAGLTGHFSAAQTPPPSQFEVASVRKVASTDPASSLRIDGETLTIRNMTVRQLISNAYSNRYYLTEIVGGPGWIDVDRFQVVAKTGRPAAPYRAMLLRLLRDRFGLRIREDNQSRPVYRATLAHPNGELGPRLTQVVVDCAAVARLPPGTATPCSVRPVPGRFLAYGTALPAVFSFMSAFIDRRVVDATGLTGQFNVDLEWEMDTPSTGITALDPSSSRGASQFSGAIFAALREQLGIRLEPATSTVPVLVIESVDHPTED